MKYEKTIRIDKRKTAFYDKILKSTNEMSDDDAYTETVTFNNGMFVDIKICGADDETPWTEAVLFDQNGSQCVFTEPCEDFFGTWSLEYENDEYIIHIERT